MANIALVTASTGGVRDNNRTALENIGHTVTVVQESDITTTDLTAFDAVAATYLSYANLATTAAELRAASDAGVPLLMGLWVTGSSATSDVITTAMDLTYRATRSPDSGLNPTIEIEIVDNTHPITNTYALGTIQIYAGRNEIWALWASDGTTPGDVLGTLDPDVSTVSGFPSLVAIESGTIDLASNPTGSRIVLFGEMGASRTAYTTAGEQLIANIVNWLLEPPAAPATDITATTILQLTASATTATAHHVRPSALLELTASATVTTPAAVDVAAETLLQLATGLALETPTEIAASALLQLTATTGLNTQPYTMVEGAAILQLVATAGVQQEHRVTADALLQLVATANITVDSAATIEAAALLQLVATAETATAHHVQPEALLQLVAATAIAQDHHVRAGTLLQLVAHEGYTGPGTGIVVPGARFTPNVLREGDTFRVVLPWAGLQGLTGLAHVNSRTLRDDRHEQDLNLHIEPLDRPNIPALAGGARPVAGADQQDYARKQARQGRELDRIERDRNR